MSKVRLCELTIFVSILGLGAAHADVIQRGYVVKLEAGQIYFDLGASSGVTTGTPLRVKRPVTLRHPVTGKDVTDELPVGELKAGAVGDSLASARLPSELESAVRVGDVVEAYVVRDEPKPAQDDPKPTLPPVEPLPEVDAETAAALQAFDAASARPAEDQIAIWNAFLADHQATPYRARIEDNVARLRAFTQELAVSETTREPTVGGLDHAPPSEADRGQPLPLAFVAAAPGTIRAAWVHYRRAGSETYRKVQLRPDGDGYLRSTVPAEAVGDPGTEYFVEVATSDGTVGAAVGTPRDPVYVRVPAPPSQLFTTRQSRSRISMRSTYLDYATFDGRSGDHTDTFFLMEADFLYRLHTVLYGIRVGFGVLSGRGGRVDALPPGETLDKTGFNYGYTELELRPKRGNLAYLARLVTGLGEDGLGFGVEGRVRIGPEEATNLTLAASTVANIGFLSELHLQWAVFPRFPLGLGVALTNQPFGGDLGVLFSADLAWRALPWFQPTVRLSYQGRTVQHSGVGAGVGLVFDW